MDLFNIRYAQTDQDIIAIHRFVSMVSGPVRFCDINPLKSVNEINRVVKDKSYGFALMATIREELVGSIGIIKPEWWYGDDLFATDRWFFVYPALENKGIGTALLATAAAHVHEEHQGKIPFILNGKPRRKANGTVFFSSHQIVEHKPENKPH